MLLCRRGRTRGGVAVVETAILLLPLFIFTLFGIWELGRLLQVEEIIANAAREGGRQASTGQRTSSTNHPELPFNADYEVQVAVENYLRNAGLPLTDAGGTPVYSVRVENVSRGLVSVYPGGSTPAKDPVSTSVQDINNNQDILRVTVTYPYQSVRWSPGTFLVPNNRQIRITSQWYSLKDIPISVDTSIPSKPQ